MEKVLNCGQWNVYFDDGLINKLNDIGVAVLDADGRIDVDSLISKVWCSAKRMIEQAKSNDEYCRVGLILTDIAVNLVGIRYATEFLAYLYT